MMNETVMKPKTGLNSQPMSILRMRASGNNIPTSEPKYHDELTSSKKRKADQHLERKKIVWTDADVRIL